MLLEIGFYRYLVAKSVQRTVTPSLHGAASDLINHCRFTPTCSLLYSTKQHVQHAQLAEEPASSKVRSSNLEDEVWFLDHTLTIPHMRQKQLIHRTTYAKIQRAH